MEKLFGKKKSNISLYLLYILIILVTSSFNCKDYVIKLYLKKDGKNEIILTFKNTSKVKCILPIDVLLSGNILSFKDAPKVNFKGVLVDAAYPFHYNKKYSINKNYIKKECNLSNEAGYKVLLPNDTFSLRYNVYENYEGLELGKEYLIQYFCRIDKEYSDFCPLIREGMLISDIIKW